MPCCFRVLRARCRREAVSGAMKKEKRLSDRSKLHRPAFSLSSGSLRDPRAAFRSPTPDAWVADRNNSVRKLCCQRRIPSAEREGQRPNKRNTRSSPGRGKRQGRCETQRPRRYIGAMGLRLPQPSPSRRKMKNSNESISHSINKRKQQASTDRNRSPPASLFLSSHTIP